MISWRLGLLYLGISLSFCAPLFSQPFALGHEDWDQHLFYRAQVLKNLVEYGAAPFWSPWYCGGNVMWQNPQVPLLGLEYPLALMMPLQLAMKLVIVVHYWLGFASTHLLLTRGIGLTSGHLAGLLSIIFTASGALAAHLAAGHSVFLPVMYLPLVLFWVVQGLRGGALRSALLAGGGLALMVWSGGMHVVPMAVTAISVLAVVAALVRRRWAPLAIAAVTFAFCGALSAPRMIPSVLFVTGDRLDDTRDFPRPDIVPASLLDDIYLDPAPDLDDLELLWDEHEYVNFIGPIAATLLIAGVAGAAVRRRADDWWLGAGLATATLFTFALSLGEFAPWSPAALYVDAPLLSGFRIPARYTIVAVLLAAATTAWTFRNVGTRVRQQGMTSVSLALAIAASAHLLLINQQLFRDAFSVRPFAVTFDWGASPTGMAIDTTIDANPGPSRSPMLEALMNERAVLECFEPLQLRRTVDPQRAPVFADAAASLRISRFSPNRIEFRVLTQDAPTRVFLNTNWNPGWRSDAGEISRTPGSPGFITIPAGRSGTYAFWFTPRGIWLGVVIMAGGLVGAARWWRVSV